MYKRQLEINVLSYATEANPSSYIISCGDATGVDATKLTSVTRDSAGDGCSFTVDPIDNLVASLQGDTTFSVPLSSTGGDTATATFTVNIGHDSGIVVSPRVPSVGFHSDRVVYVDARQFVSDSGYVITCDASPVYGTRGCLLYTSPSPRD